jgi:hypothetical protein
VFGHADPSYEGNFEMGSATQNPGDDYNKALSGHRATAVYGVLIANQEISTSVSLWQKIASAENWGVNQQQVMQQATGLPDGTPMASLITNYLQKLCPSDLNLGKKDFLAQGADPDGKGDYQGCSRFNPLVLFSDTDEQRFKTALQQQDKGVLQERNDKNAPNRRVMVLMFKKGTQVDLAKWPCPSASGDKSGCLKRFWSDGQARRGTHLPDEERRFAKTQDTFACRFYQRLVTNSPCEQPLTIVKIRLFDPQARPLPFAPCLITETGRASQPARATGAPPSPLGTTPGSPPGSPCGGNEEDAVVTFRVFNLPTTLNIKWSRPKAQEGPGAPLPSADDPDDFEYEMDVAVDIPQGDPTQPAQIRLKNLGYDVNPPIPVPWLGDPIEAFQSDYKRQCSDIVVDGTLNTPTTDAITTRHDTTNTVLRGGSDIAEKR